MDWEMMDNDEQNEYNHIWYSNSSGSYNRLNQYLDWDDTMLFIQSL